MIAALKYRTLLQISMTKLFFTIPTLIPIVKTVQSLAYERRQLMVVIIWSFL